MANDKIEITDEMIADAKMCVLTKCSTCRVYTTKEACGLRCIELFAAALEAERAKGPGVWTDAPQAADLASIKWYGGLERLGLKEYRRNHSKTSSRLRAESIIGHKGEKLDGDEWERAVAAVERELG